MDNEAWNAAIDQVVKILHDPARHAEHGEMSDQWLLTHVRELKKETKSPELELSELEKGIDELAFVIEGWKKIRARVTALTEENKRNYRKWWDYEQEHVLPCFKWAEELGLDLQKQVMANAGKNCTALFFEWLRERAEAWRNERPIDLVLLCPNCNKQHLDVGEFRDRVHRKHLCENTPEGPNAGCGNLWMPRWYATRGVTTDELTRVDARSDALIAVLEDLVDRFLGRHGVAEISQDSELERLFRLRGLILTRMNDGASIVEDLRRGDRGFREVLAALGRARACDECGNPATCIGSYEDGPWGLACDECCGHGNEDGRCFPLGTTT